jgi:1,4-alpha-glucan branching enzyme
MHAMKNLHITEIDPWLKPYSDIYKTLHNLSEKKEIELCNDSALSDFAQGHRYFGIHKEKGFWHIREWAPNATEIFLTGDFNNWALQTEFAFEKQANGKWELKLEESQLKHGDLYALQVKWEGGEGKRIPAWAQRVVQDNDTKIFNAQVWYPPKEYKWKNKNFRRKNEAPLIYEAHIGMAGEEERVHTYNEFRKETLPRIKEAGYNVIQFMAIPEHPYYGSFGYHVSSFFAPSSRFGTPDELKALIDEAHSMDIAVIIDLVHSHAVKNEVEGLGKFDGTQHQFFHEGGRGLHPAWDSYCFNYNKNEVLHFLLSNIRFWLDEFQFDGYRFDGVTSMLYLDHGLEKAFSGYDDYFSPNLDYDAIVYFILANKLIHEFKPGALSIAEDVSGMPGLAAPITSGGFGFDYRMSMGVPDYWIKLIKEQKDEEWEVGDIFHQMNAHRDDEKVVNYAESHDQALVGDKTIIFRLIDKEMYFSMRKDQPNLTVDRGIALHKMIRLITASCAGGAYLNFMGNEFGHPEWIDFPREGNNWSYKHASRLWSISDNNELKYQWLKDFDRDMIALIKENNLLATPEVYKIWENKADQVLVFKRNEYLFIFNFNPTQSFADYGIPLNPSKYNVVLNTDSGNFGGFDRIDERITYYTIPTETKQHYLRLYIPSRSAFVLKQERFKNIK